LTWKSREIQNSHISVLTNTKSISEKALRFINYCGENIMIWSIIEIPCAGDAALSSWIRMLITHLPASLDLNWYSVKYLWLFCTCLAWCGLTVELRLITAEQITVELIAEFCEDHVNYVGRGSRHSIRTANSVGVASKKENRRILDTVKLKALNLGVSELRNKREEKNLNLQKCVFFCRKKSEIC
jgi:hypothetical protein